MSAAANIAKALELKEQGNTAFKDGDYPKAIAAYHQIFMYVHGYSAGSAGASGMPGQTTTPVTPEEMAQIKELKLTHFNNLAMCHLKQGPNWQKARANCTKALELDPKNVKALFRRGKCNAQLNHLDEAKEDLERVLELQPDNKDAVRELRGLKSQFASQRKKEQKKFAGMFDKLSADDDAARDAVQPGGGSGGAPAPSAPADAGDDDDDMGEPLGAPQAFEPHDVLYRQQQQQAAGGTDGAPVSVA